MPYSSRAFRLALLREKLICKWTLVPGNCKYKTLGQCSARMDSIELKLIRSSQAGPTKRTVLVAMVKAHSHHSMTLPVQAHRSKSMILLGQLATAMGLSGRTFLQSIWTRSYWGLSVFQSKPSVDLNSPVRQRRTRLHKVSWDSATVNGLMVGFVPSSSEAHPY